HHRLHDMLPLMSRSRPPLPRSMRAPSTRAVADGTRIVDLLYGRRRVNVEDRGLVEGMAIDAMHRLALGEYLRPVDGLEGTRRYRGTRGMTANVESLVSALIAYACIDVTPERRTELIVEVTAASYPAIGRGWQVFMRGEEQREARRRVKRA